MNPLSDPLFALLRPSALTRVVDIGANPIDGTPPYRAMLDRGLCVLVGFEPQTDALARLNAAKSELETYLPYCVGDGARRKLRICRASGMSSLYEPDPRMLTLFHGFPEWGQVTGEVDVETRRLDEIQEINAIDFLKIDVQGSELSVFESGIDKLSRAVAIQTEVSFLPLYREQPVWGDVDRVLRGMGFVPHAFAAVNRRAIAPIMLNNDPYSALNQLLEADVVYVRDFIDPEAMDDEQLKHLALVSHHCYGSVDLANRCVLLLTRRGSLAEDAPQRYLALAQQRLN